MHTRIHQIEEWRQALFVGYFGPIGVSAIFYLYTARDLLESITVDGVQREDAARLEEILTVVVWFMTIVSIVAHGLSIPLGKVGWHLPRALSTISSRSMSRPGSGESGADSSFHVNRGDASAIELGSANGRPHQIFRVGRAVIQNPRAKARSENESSSEDGTQTPRERTGGNEETLRNHPPPNPRQHEGEVTSDRESNTQEDGQGTPEDNGNGSEPSAEPGTPGAVNRSVKFAALSENNPAYSKGRNKQKGDRSKHKNNNGTIQKQDIRVVGARPMAGSTVPTASEGMMR